MSSHRRLSFENRNHRRRFRLLPPSCSCFPSVLALFHSISHYRHCHHQFCSVPASNPRCFRTTWKKKSNPVITKCKGENWTKVTFKPDLEKFKMAELEEDVIVLMKKRVVDMVGCLGKTVKVELNGKAIKLKSFYDYANLYLKSAEKSKPTPFPRSFAKIGDIWEICVSLSDGQFQQVVYKAEL